MLSLKPAACILIFCVFTSVSASARQLKKINRVISTRTVSLQTPVPPMVGEEDDPESQSSRAYHTTVRNLFNEENFSQLEEIADAARSGKSRFKGGGWKLDSFYAAIKTPGSLTATDAAWNSHMERLKRWIAFRPDSSTPRVALAQAYLRFAWKARGGGYADTVTPEGWNLFRERVQKAKENLEAAKSFPTKDPQWFLAMQTVALAQQWNNKQVEKLLEEAYAFEPGYYYYYDSYANFLLPKWSGKPGDSEEFAQTIADRIGGSEGDFVYFRVALSLNCCKAHEQAPALSWDRVKQGFASLEELYGSTNYQRNAIAYMAVRQEDKDFAQQLFARIGDNWNQRVWRSKAKFDRSKASLSLNR
jgi:hypothetical protein